MNPYPYPPPFASAHLRARIVKILLIVGAFAAAASLFFDALEFAFPTPTDDQEIGDNPIAAIRILIGLLVALFEITIYLATVIAFVMWLYRAYTNLRAFDPSRPLDNSPGWAVGSFFIPFVCLIVPYRAVKEVWQKSGPPEMALLSEPNPPAYFPIWWMFWLLSSFAGNISMRVSFEENVAENVAATVSIIASALSIIAAVFAYLVVDDIDKRQEETSGRLNLGRFTGPPPPPANLAMSELGAG